MFDKVMNEEQVKDMYLLHNDTRYMLMRSKYPSALRNDPPATVSRCTMLELGGTSLTRLHIVAN